jgi:putative heme-binding domain-containing protein
VTATRLVALSLALALAAPAAAQRNAKTLSDAENDPEVERKSFIVDPAFEVNLFAADPLLAKPIQMNFDPNGRLWVASSEVYPQVSPGQTADDKVLILEDTKRTGKADKITIFARGLLIPTGVEPGDGGAYVADSTDLVHLTDADGDGRAERRVVLSGFGTEDTHHILHTLRWGHDGHLYMNQSIYIHSHIETPHGPRRLGGGGTWRFRPETLELDVFMRGMVNPWGHHFDRWGVSFGTDGAGGEGINYVVPGAGYPTAVGIPKLLHGLNPGSPKYCGLEVISGRHLPPEWDGDHITNDFRGHRVCRFKVSPEGAGYTSRELGELIKTNHPAFRPIDVKMGPDGAIYIADWYNPIIQHGEVDFRDPRRDHTRGRIWRVTAKGRPLAPRPEFAALGVDAILDLLKSPEGYARQRARRVLKEKGATAVLPALAKWTAAAGDDATRLEALWMYQSLDTPEPELLKRCLTATTPQVRAAAARVLGDWTGRLPDALTLLAARAADEHPQVRLEAVRSLGRVADRKAAEAALTVLDKPTDKWIDYALWLTLRELEPQWVPALQAGQFDLGGVRRALFLLESAGRPEVLGPLVALWKSGKVPAADEPGVLGVVARLGGPAEATALLDAALALPAADGARRAALTAALEQMAKVRRVRPTGDATRAATLLDAADEPTRLAAARLAGLWKLESLRPRLAKTAGDPATPDAVRRAAFDALASLGGKATHDELLRLAAADRPAAVRRAAVIALAGLDPKAAASRAVEVIATDPAAVVAPFLARKDGPPALAAALKEKTLPTDAAKLALRAVKEAGRELPELTSAFTAAGRLTGGVKPLSAEEMKQAVADVARLGDPARGEAVFRRPAMQCLKCHSIVGAGGLVGPGLESIGASAQVDYLIDSLLLPTKQVKEGYHTALVTTSDGKLVTGIKVRQTDTDLILRDAEGREVSVPLKDIDEQAVGKSLMPEGLVEPLTRGELLDLVRFLSELGKVGPYAVGKTPVLRRWQALAADKPAYETLGRKGLSWLAKEPGLTWSPAYSRVAGDLPLDGLPQLKRNDGRLFTVVRGQVEVTTPGKLGLRLAPGDGLELWVDGAPTPAASAITLDLAKGVHTLTLAVPAGPASVRAELADVAGSAARAAFVGGP